MNNNNTKTNTTRNHDNKKIKITLRIIIRTKAGVFENPEP
jgi:hypothetical protein